MNIEPKLIRGLGFAGTSETWDAVMAVLEESITIETTAAISRETEADQRIHAAGRPEALTEFRSDLLALRQQAKIETGVESVKVHAKGG